MIQEKRYLFKGKDFNILESEWNTENTYDNNFKVTPESSGVYLIVGVDYLPKFEMEIIYVGSTKNLKQRKSGHKIINDCRFMYDNIKFYFKECDDFLEKERYFIKKIKPYFNKQFNPNYKNNI